MRLSRRRAKGISARLQALKRLEKSPRPRSALESACIQRQIGDLENEGQNGLIWDEDEAVRNVEFCSLLRHWKGEWGGQRFVPTDAQEHLCIAPLFGWYRDVGGQRRRRFTVGYDEEPRKNGKTFKAAAIALQGLMADGEAGAECYAAASTRDQASILFRDAQNCVRQNADLAEKLGFFRNSLTCDYLSSFLKPVSSEANTLHGHNIHRAVIDEIHAQPNRDLWDVIQTGTGARRNPLVFGITTAGHDRASICWELHEYARSVLEGHHKDDTFFAYITCAELDDDPFDPATWAKANPNLDISIKSDYLAREANKARTSPSYENTFRRLHLNQWTEQAVRWIPMHVWDECTGDVTDREELERMLAGRECYAGLDLASTRDVNSLVLAFPFDDGSVVLLPFFWAPEEVESARAEQDRRQVKQWMERGLIAETSGNVTDYSQIVTDIIALSLRFEILDIAYDPWNAEAVVQQLTAAGYSLDRMTKFPQTIGNFAGPTKELERLVIGRKLRHAGNHVLRWMASNVTVRSDPSGNIRPDKAKSSDKIDGIVASIMAIGGVLAARELTHKSSAVHVLAEGSGYDEAEDEEDF